MKGVKEPDSWGNSDGNEINGCGTETRHCRGVVGKTTQRNHSTKEATTRERRLRKLKNQNGQGKKT